MRGGPGEKRTISKTRYLDIANSTGALLLIEQFYGEDSMKNPQEWLQILRNNRYRPFLFRLKVSEPVILCRNKHRPDYPKSLKEGFNCYCNPQSDLENNRNADIPKFSKKSNLIPIELDGDYLEPLEIAYTIISKTGLMEKTVK